MSHPTAAAGGSVASSSRGGVVYRPSYNRSTSSGSSSENLPPKVLARVAREVKSLHQNPPEGVRLVVDGDSGLPSSLGELVVRCHNSQSVLSRSLVSLCLLRK